MSRCVDSSYAVYDDIRGYTGRCTTLGSGMIHCKSSKKKQNTKSSTESEVIGASDYLPFNIWCKYFIEVQGYLIKRIDFNQDNIYSMRLEKHGNASSGQATRYINIRYFFMKDRIQEDEINIIYCPTELMVADYVTKPLHGSLFEKLRDGIMGYTHPSSLRIISYSPDEESVEISTKLGTSGKFKPNGKILSTTV